MKKLIVLIAICTSILNFSIAQNIDQAYIDFLKTKFKNFEKKMKKNDGVFIDDRIVYIVIDSSGKGVEGTSFPTVLKESSQYKFAIILLTVDGDDSNYEFKIDGKEYNPANEFNILQTYQDDTDDITVEFAGTTQNIIMKVSDTSDVYSEKVFFEVTKNDATLFKWDTKLTSVKEYSVAIMGGYFYSTLNNPTNVTSFVFDSGTDSTLVGDFTDNQRKITVMAIFYPWGRKSDYRWSKLKWYEYASVGFGIGVDEDLFQDLFLGLNLEFAKGGYLSGGIHLGKHNVLSNRSDFDYGTDIWNREFDNSLMREQWDIGYYVGVTIDFRVIAQMIGARDRLSENNDKDK